MAEVEVEPFGDLDRPDLYYEFYPEMYPKLQGSMVPFGFRILVAELPQYLGKTSEALDRLYALLSTVSQVIYDSKKNELEEILISFMIFADVEESRGWQIRSWKLYSNE